MNESEGTSNRWMRDFSGWVNPVLLILASFFFWGMYQPPWLALAFLALNEFICTGIKLIFWKPRPDKKSYNNWIEKIETGAFPSIHSARAAFFGLSLLGPIQGDLPYFKLVLILVFFTLVGLSRIRLKKHDWIDVSAGWLIGITLGIILIYV